MSSNDPLQQPGSKLPRVIVEGEDFAAVAEAVARLARGSVTVIGDVMLDRYVYGQVSQISAEAPVPVLAVEREVALPGGAANVVRNITALGAAAALVSVLGDDQAGSDLTGLIGGQPKVEPWLLVQGTRRTTQKTRFVARGQHMLRADQEEVGPIHPKLAERMLRIAGDALAATSVTVLSDYRKGVLAGDTPALVLASARAAGRPVVVSSAGPDYARFEGARLLVLTPAQLAGAALFVGQPPIPRDEGALAAAASALADAHGFGAVAVARGAAGLLLVEKGEARAFLMPAGEALDSSGYVDSLVGTLAAGLAAGLDLLLACRVAALAGTVVLNRGGVAVATPRDLLAVLTPQGRALRKIMPAEAAAEQLERWRGAGQRCAVVSGADLGMLPALLAAARPKVDRLVVAMPSDVALRVRGVTPEEAEAARSARAASLPETDLVAAYDEATEETLLAQLRPAAALIRPAWPELGRQLAAWGGVVLDAG